MKHSARDKSTPDGGLDTPEEELLRLQRVVAIAGLGYYTWDNIRMRFEWVSEEFAGLHGCSVDVFMSTYGKEQEFLKRIIAKDRESVGQIMREQLTQRQGFDLEFRIITLDGRLRVVHEVLEPLELKDGQMTRGIGVIRDITDRIHSEQTVEKAQRLAKLGNWRWSAEHGELISGSDEYARIHGVRTEEIHTIMAEKMGRIIYPPDREVVEKEFKRFADEGEDYEIEYRIVRPDGEVRELLEIGESIRGEDGRIIEQAGTVQDITELKRVQRALAHVNYELETRVIERTEALKESERKYRELFEQAPISIWEEDWSAVKPMITMLKEQGIEDFERYFLRHPELVREIDLSVILLDFNRTTLDMYNAPSFEEWQKKDNESIDDPNVLRKTAITVAKLAQGENRVVVEGWESTYDGEPLYARDVLYIPEENRQDWKRLLRTTEDVTARQLAIE